MIICFRRCHVSIMEIVVGGVLGGIAFIVHNVYQILELLPFYVVHLTEVAAEAIVLLLVRT